MIFSSFILIALASSGASAMYIDFGPRLDDLIKSITKVMRAHGDTEIDFEPLQGSVTITDNQFKEFFILNKLAKKPKYLQNFHGPVEFTYNCTGGKLGDITTVKRVGPAIDAEYGLILDFYTLVAELSLQKMYVEYPSCEITANQVNQFHAKVIINVPFSTFATMFKAVEIDGYCITYVPGTVFLDFETKTKAYVADIEDTFLEYLFDQLIEQNPIKAEIGADSYLLDALNNALGSVDSCRFLRRADHAKGYKPAHGKAYKPKHN